MRQLERRSNLAGCLQLTAHLALLTTTGLLVRAARGSPWILPAPVAHAAHHRHTQDPGRDPELATPAPASRAGWLLRISGFGYWRAQLRTTLSQVLTGRSTEVFVPADRVHLVVRQARLLWALYFSVLVLSILTARTDALVYWIVPALLGQPVLRLFLLAEHTGCELSPDMLANTRTTYTHAALRLLCWRMSFHTEHHCFPAVPFHALAELNQLLRTELKVTAPGYLRLHSVLLSRWRDHRDDVPTP